VRKKAIMNIGYNKDVDKGKEFYFITINNRGFSDEEVSQLLHISFDEYVEILLINGGYKYHNKGYIFNEKENVETALVTLKILINNI